VIFLAFTLLLYAIAAALLAIAVRRRDGSARRALVETGQEFVNLLPRLAVGVIGAGYIAHLLPHERVTEFLGPASGWGGIAIACIAGALTPGGPVVGFSLGAAALKAGAGTPQIVAFVTAWSLYTLNRMLVWELPFMPKAFIVRRIVVSLPIPVLAAGFSMLMG
jgi:uncharacterized membrane protein YraQ (UPF0718 family)